MSKVVASCEFYSPINRESSFGSIPVSDRMFSTMELFWFCEGAGMIEWCVFDDDGECEFVENIGCTWDEDTNEFQEYDGVFDIPREAISLLQSFGIKFDPEEWENELNYPLNDTFKLTR
mgnify:CR=1 FL=1